MESDPPPQWPPDAVPQVIFLGSHSPSFPSGSWSIFFLSSYAVFFRSRLFSFPRPVVLSASSPLSCPEERTSSLGSLPDQALALNPSFFVGGFFSSTFSFSVQSVLCFIHFSPPPLWGSTARPSGGVKRSPFLCLPFNYATSATSRARPFPRFPQCVSAPLLFRIRESKL